MKKNVLLRTLASMSAIAILGVSTIIGASASAEKDIPLSIDKVTGKAGETVTVAISVDNNQGLDGMGAEIQFDEGLTLGTAKAGSLSDLVSVTPRPGTNNFVFSVAVMEVSTDTEGTIALIDFTIPEDAEPGTVYDITWVNLDDFTNGSNSYVDRIDLVNGSITVEGGGGTTPPAPPATTTPEETTTPATEDEAPKTGASTKGIAATSAVLLAAACSAVALKKKRD
jgi:hypothetical protein